MAAFDKGRAGFDQTHRITSNMSYELPVGKGRRWLNHGGVTNAVLGGWNLVYTYQLVHGTHP